MLGAIEAGGTKFVCAVGDEKEISLNGSNSYNGTQRNHGKGHCYMILMPLE